MNRPGYGVLRAAPLALLLGALACGPGGGGCGPDLDADKIAAEAKKGTDAKGGAPGTAAARSKMSDALAAKGDGYKPGAYADSLSGFSSTGGSNGTPKGEFARLASSLPPTPENQKIITQALGQDSARSGPGGSTDLAGNGGYVTVGKGADGQPAWQWNAYDGAHAAPKGFDKPYAPFRADPGAGDASAAFAARPSASPASSDSTDPLSSGAPPGFTGCWPRPPGLHHIALHLMGGNGNRRVVDSTPIVCSATYCHAIGFSNRGCCPLRQEGASQHAMRVKCEAELMGRDRDGRVGPRWVYKGNGGVEKHPENPYLAWGYGNGWVGACSNVSPVCNWIEVINHPDPASAAAAAASGAAAPAGGGGSSSAAKSPATTSASPATAPTRSTSTVITSENLETLIPVIPEVAPAATAP